MQVENSMNQRIASDNSPKISVQNKAYSSNALALQNNFNQHLSQKIDTFSTNQVSTLSINEKSSNIKLGALSGNQTTVAQLLLANPELKSKTWSIIHNPINKNKAFHQISAGKDIFYNPKTQELSWSEVNSRQSTTISKNALAGTATASLSISHQKIALGQINQENPTISNLLSQQSNFKAQRWNIIHSDINKNKAFTNIPNNTTIYIDTKTKELSWNHSTQIAETKTQSQKETSPASTQSTLLARKLDDAVKPYMGTDYKHLDCYTLVVNGLENMGIRYRGRGSLSSQLQQRAQLDGRANNAYFTGEGITEALGDKIYSKAISSINNIDKQSKDIFQEMKNLMKKGDILSFSLQTKGHTGVISQSKDQWTYINSGRLDNSINSNSPKHGVGEETLINEINNWIKLAQQRKEALQITVGRIDKEKIA